MLEMQISIVNNNALVLTVAFNFLCYIFRQHIQNNICNKKSYMILFLRF